MKLWRWILPVSAFFLVLILDVIHASCLERDDLGKVLKIMPPNGPAARYGNVVMRQKCKKAGIAPVVFPHWNHRARYTCRVCHVELEFAMRSGGSGITREKYLRGKFCGTCHNGIVAFGAGDGAAPACNRCHMEDPTLLDQRFGRFASGLPHAQYGNGIDWSAALAEGRILPLQTLSQGLLNPTKALQKPLDLGTGAPRSYVAFSHQQHLAEMDCSICHPDIFNIKKKGTRHFCMEVNIYGQFCGVCHMRVAFPMNDCRRCHPEMSSKSIGF